MTKKPRYHVHDCEKCKHLGSFELFNPMNSKVEPIDLYVCEDSRDLKWSNLIARRSSEPGDYASTPACMVNLFQPLMAYAFGLWLRELGCNGANPKEGMYFKGSEVILDLN